MNYLELLQEFVDLGGKKTGSPAGQRAGELIRNRVREFAENRVTIKTEQFPLNSWSGTAEIHCPGFSLPACLLDYSGNRNQPVCGKLVYAGIGSKLDFLLKNLQNRIVVCKSALLVHRVIQTSRAVAGGALGIIIISGHQDSLQQGIACPADEEYCQVPVFSITGNDWQRLKTVINQKVEMSYQRKIVRTTGNNIIVDFQPDRQPDHADHQPEKWLAIGAHYDSWLAGAQDNCVSVVMLLGLIEQITALPWPGNIRFIFFDGEELGLLGAKYHVQNNDMQQCRAYINLEMVVPCLHSRLKTLFISRKIPLTRLPLLRIVKNLFLPLSLDIFYGWGNKSFPADVDPWYKEGVPCMTTYCDNRFYHTDEDRVDRIQLTQFPAIQAMLFACVQGLAGYEDKSKK